ncbi:hypothetical protein HMSSN036_02460 [Paenibacillus macerans]|nr:hypothetical protein HMSSN036_02460 [Paenibacillus macerans]
MFLIRKVVIQVGDALKQLAVHRRNREVGRGNVADEYFVIHVANVMEWTGYDF